MAANRCVVNLWPSAEDAPYVRRLLEEAPRMPAVAQGATSTRYDMRDAILIVHWSLDCRSSSPTERGAGVVLVDKLDAARALLDRLSAREFPFKLVEVSDECLTWPSAGWRAGPR